jgi:hypothetical protein
MKKLIGAYFVTALIFVSTPAFAEIYKVDFVAPSNTGSPWNYGFVVDLQFSEDGAISGEIKDFFGVRACRWAGFKVSGKKSPDGQIRWVSERHFLKGCGALTFVGKMEGENLVGYMPSFQGVKVDLVLEPKK